MSSHPTAPEIAASARWLAQALDPGAGLVRFVELTPDAYRGAAFLDDRLLQQQPQLVSALLPWSEVEPALGSTLRRDARWIFHIGHVGSTLVSRLLGELPTVLALREPRALRDLTFFPVETRARFIPGVQALMSRTFAAGETALVKATSMVSELAAELVPAVERALFLYAAPQRYIQGLLAGDNSREELAMLASTRAERMRGRVPAMPDSTNSPAHLAAAAWACEMTSLEAAADAMPDRPILWRDFDRMLTDMPAALGELAEHFGFVASPADLSRIVGGPLMKRYSKALEYDYSPDLRRQLLQQAGADHRADIAAALEMLDKAARESPLLKRALDRADGEL